MNGRCQKDALDRAEDICELCSNQYCAHCLLFPRGHRNPPTCKTCALENSGIRGGSAKHTAISKREYKKLKKELLAQLEEVEEKQPAIEYFELKDPSQFDRSNELDRRPAPPVAEEPTIDILNTGAAETPAPAQSIPPAPQTPTPHPTTAPPAAAPPAVAPPAAAPPAAQPAFAETAETTAEAFAPVDTSVNPLELNWSERRAAAAPAPAPPAPSEASASAAELLARLKADQPIQSQFSSAPAELDTDPFAPSSATPVAQPAPAPVPASLAPSAPAQVEPAPSQQPSTWSPPTPPPRGTNLAAKLAESEAAQGPPASRSGSSFPAAAFPESPTHESPFTAEPVASVPVAPAAIAPTPSAPTPSAPAPAVPEPIQASPFHDAPIAPAPVAHQPIQASPFHDAPINPAHIAQAPLGDSPFGDPSGRQRPSQAAPPVERRALTPETDALADHQPERRNADTDDTGQWIPPSLRGMSTTDERDPLPKRRS